MYNQTDPGQTTTIIGPPPLILRKIREFDTLKCKKVPQSLEIGFFFVKFLFLLYSNI